MLLDGALAAFTTVAGHARLLSHHLERASLLDLELHGILSLRFLHLDVHLLTDRLPVQVDPSKITRRLILILLNVEHERVQKAVTVKFGLVAVVDSRVDALV